MDPTLSWTPPTSTPLAKTSSLDTISRFHLEERTCAKVWWDVRQAPCVDSANTNFSKMKPLSHVFRGCTPASMYTKREDFQSLDDGRSLTAAERCIYQWISALEFYLETKDIAITPHHRPTMDSQRRGYSITPCAAWVFGPALSSLAQYVSPSARSAWAMSTSLRRGGTLSPIFVCAGILHLPRLLYKASDPQATACHGKISTCLSRSYHLNLR